MVLYIIMAYCSCFSCIHTSYIFMPNVRPCIYVSSPLIFTEDLAGRPKLNLKPRSTVRPVNEMADTTQRSSIFGEGKPRKDKST